MARARKNQPARFLKARSYHVLIGKEVVELMRGDEVPAEHVEQLEAEGALLPLRKDQVEDEESTTPALPPLNASKMSVATLAKGIAERQLSAEDTVALAKGDKDLAGKVLEAENAANGDAPRDEVKSGLEALQA